MLRGCMYNKFKTLTFLQACSGKHNNDSYQLITVS